MNADLVSAGFYVTHLLDRPDGLAKQAPLPKSLLTLSECLTSLLPNSWALEWVSCSHDQRVKEVSKLGIAAEHLDGLIRFATTAFNDEHLGWPNVWQSLAVARAVKAAFAATNSSLVILELGVPCDFAEKLLVDAAPQYGEAESGFHSRLKAHARLDDTGVPVGWEPLGAEVGGSFHSWLCNHLQDEGLARLGIAPGAFGLLSTEQEARAIISLIEGGLGAEPVPWFPGLLCRFD